VKTGELFSPESFRTLRYRHFTPRIYTGPCRGKRLLEIIYFVPYSERGMLHAG